MTNYNFYTGQKWGKASNYTLCLNSSQLGYGRCEAVIMECAKKKSGYSKIPSLAVGKKKWLHTKQNQDVQKKSQKISTQLLIMEVDFCPVLCILEVPVLQAFRGISHFVWYCKAVSDLS